MSKSSVSPEAALKYRNIIFAANTTFEIDKTLFNLKELMDERKRVAIYLTNESYNYNEDEKKHLLKTYDYLNEQMKRLLNL